MGVSLDVFRMAEPHGLALWSGFRVEAKRNCWSALSLTLQ